MMLPMGDQKSDKTGPGTAQIIGATSVGMTATAVLSWLAWLLLDRPMDELAGWIEAGATVAAVGAAIIAGFYAARAYGLEHQREQRLEDANRSAQASQVVVWPTGPTYSFQDSENFLSTVSATLRNASDLPVTDVTVKFYLLLDDGSAQDGQYVASFTMPFVAPDRTEQIRLDLSSYSLGRTFVRHTTGVRLATELSFRDVSSTAWRRDIRGLLEIGEPAAVSRQAD